MIVIVRSYNTTSHGVYKSICEEERTSHDCDSAGRVINGVIN